MCHFVGKDNIGLVCIRNNRDDAETYFVTTILADKTVISPKDNASIYPLYLYNEDGTNILLQEYIEESAGTDIRAFVVGGKVIASMQRQSLDDDFRSKSLS